jgi:ATP-binding cassette, subfamily B, bacterial PglK
MFKTINEVFTVLTHKQRSKLYIMQFILLGASVVELVGITSIAPYLAVVADPALIQKNPILSNFYSITGSESNSVFLIYLGILVLLLVLISNTFSIISTWVITKYSQFTGQEFAIRLYKYYLTRPYLFHTKNNSSTLMSRISQETNRVTFHVIYPFMQINAKLISVVLILVGLTVLDPFLASVAACILVGSYLLIFNVVKTILSRNGEIITKENAERFRAMNEGFGGIKELKLLNREAYYGDIFERSSVSLASVTTINLVISVIPRYLLEIMAFGGILSVTLYLLFEQGDFNAVIPVLSIYALAGFKLLPAFQQIYGSLANLRAGISAFDAVKKELGEAKAEELDLPNFPDIIPDGDIELREIKFRYSSASEEIFNNLNLTIKKNTTIGIAGSSGAGKTTLVDIILGLIAPIEGELIVNNNVISNENIKAWQSHLGYVPQSIFLADTSIASNIAFGVDAKDIDFVKLESALEMSKLNEFVSTLPEGVNTIVGERGAQLSGGQRQRIGIARALYRDASVLVLDEATSALDGIMESEVMEAISGLHHEKTIIIIAHRLTTLKTCDTILFIDNGKLIEQGTYEYLNNNSEIFKKMSNI